MTQRKPSHLKALHGTERPDREKPAPPRSAAGATAPKPPSWLDAYGRQKWRELAPELEVRQLLTGDALALLELLCAAWSDFRHAQAVVRRAGGSYESKKGKEGEGDTMHRKRPEVAQAQAARKDYAQLLAQFTARISGVEPVQERDPMDDFLARRRRGSRSAAS
jgi:P27 family predicted phage terminase small subunit